ncbi:MAG: endopeptidase La, partial [Clostridia bacterium]|nr:endopeptidase La [Clostridia bacterium]
AVRVLNPELKGQILCLVGPPGVGKSSIGRSIADAISRKFVRVSLGGVRDEADIRGHRKTYIGAMPGRIIAALSQAGSRNPLILLDELDKMGNDYKGDPSAAMLEVLDTEQNHTFRDHYIELPFDLSQVLFVATANTLDTIPAPLQDRMEIIELGSYNREGKFHIAKKHLIPKQLVNNGLTSTNCKFSTSAIYAIIDGYTREAGVRNLERRIAAVMRKVAKNVASGDTETVFKIDSKNIEDHLGPKKFKDDQLAAKHEVGLVNGLAWTAVGGETLPIEVAVVPGTGKIELTGSLGDVMKESAKIAVTCVRTRAEKLGIDVDFYKTKDIHIHAPEGAVPKDGPSAGITMTTAIVSALTDKPVNRLVAMTGEITLRGKVLPIGGLKEKSMGAYKMGIKTIIIPKQNESDLYEIDETVKENVNIIPVETIDEVLDIAFTLDKTYEKAPVPKPAKSTRKASKKIEKTEKMPNDTSIIIGVAE